MLLYRTMKKRIICCGNIAYDLIAAREENKGGYTLEARPGGSVFNTAILLSRLGLGVSVLAKSGNDFLGDTLLDVMRREKIDTEHIIRDELINTGLALAQIDKRGNSSYLFYRSMGPHTAFSPKELPLSIFKSADAFHTGSGFSYTDHTFESTLGLMIKASREGVFTTYDPNWREGRIKNKKKTRSRIQRLIAHADLLKLSDADAIGITGKKTLSAALKHLARRGYNGRQRLLFLERKGKNLLPGHKSKGCGHHRRGGRFYRGPHLQVLFSREGQILGRNAGKP